MRTRPILAAALGALLATTADGPASRPAHAREAGVPASVGGPFDLVDQDGRRVTDRDFRGRLMLIYFGYTSCPDVCPTTLQGLGQGLDELGADAARVAFLFVTVDPARDTPERLKAYVAAFRPAPVGLTGTPEQVDRAARAYRAYVRRRGAKGGADYAVDHSGLVYLMGRDGGLLATLPPDTTPEDVAAALRHYL